MTEQTLAERILNQTNMYAATNRPWVQFVRDHRRAILAQARAVTITPETMNRYQYRLEDYLRTQSVDLNLLWLVMELNSLNSAADFNGLDSLWLPDAAQLRQLYAQAVSAKEKTVSNASAALSARWVSDK